MCLDIISTDILQNIIDILTFTDKLCFVEALKSSRHFAAELRNLKPLIVFAAFNPVSRLDGVAISNGVHYATGPIDWGNDMERRENWVSMYHLDSVLNLYIPIDLVIYLASSGWTETFQRVLPLLNLENVNSINYEFYSFETVLSEDDPRPSQPWIDLSTCGKDNCKPKLSSLKVAACFFEELAIPKEFDLDVLLIEDASYITQLPHKVRKLSIRNTTWENIKQNFLIPKGVCSLEMSSRDLCRSDVLNMISKIILANINLLEHVDLRETTIITGRRIDPLIKSLIRSPTLRKITTNCPFNLELLNLENYEGAVYTSWDITETIWTTEREGACTWEKLQRAIEVNTDIEPDPTTSSKLFPWDYNLLEQIELLPQLKVIDAYRDVSKLPEKIPSCLEKIIWACYGTGLVSFENFHCLHTLNLTNTSLHLVEGLPRSLKLLTGKIKKYPSSPLDMNRIINQVPNLKYLCITETNVPIAISGLPPQLAQLSLKQGYNKNPSELKSESENMVNHFSSGKGIFNIGSLGFSTVSGSNLWYLCVEIPVPSNRNQPIALPWSLEVLIFSSHLPETSYLQFPKNCNTNLRFIQFVVSGTYSYYNIGHGRDGTCHARLKYMLSNNPPQIDDLRPNTIITDSVYFNDANCPPNLDEIYCFGNIYLNPKKYSPQQAQHIRMRPQWNEKPH